MTCPLSESFPTSLPFVASGLALLPPLPQGHGTCHPLCLIYSFSTPPTRLIPSPPPIFSLISPSEWGPYWPLHLKLHFPPVFLSSPLFSSDTYLQPTCRVFYLLMSWVTHQEADSVQQGDWSFLCTSVSPAPKQPLPRAIAQWMLVECMNCRVFRRPR